VQAFNVQASEKWKAALQIAQGRHKYSMPGKDCDQPKNFGVDMYVRLFMSI